MLARASEGSIILQSHEAPVNLQRLQYCIQLSNMSRTAKLTLAGTSVMAVGIVAFVHFAQQSEKAVG